MDQDAIKTLKTLYRKELVQMALAAIDDVLISPSTVDVVLNGHGRRGYRGSQVSL